MKARYFLFFGISLFALFLGWKFVTMQTVNRVEEVSPTEDLMREHGVLSRILLIYEEIIAQIDDQQALPNNVVHRSAEIVRSFIENYHEKLEEDHVFTRFEKNNTLIDLVQTLRDQHQKGRLLTEYILIHSNDAEKQNSPEQEKLEDTMQLFIDMYRPHAAREDTVLFPAFKTIISESEYDRLGETFEEKENELFGKDGFNHIVNDVAGIEKELGIYDLAQFSHDID
jgi:hemerythrin-like domain-containing protein